MGYLSLPIRESNPEILATPAGGGDVTAVAVTNGGTGHTDGTPTGVVAVGGSGTGLTLDLTISAGVITNAVVNNAGTGYVTGDTVTVPSEGGSGEVLTLTANALTPFINGSPKTGAYIRPRSNINPYHG